MQGKKEKKKVIFVRLYLSLEYSYDTNWTRAERQRKRFSCPGGRRRLKSSIRNINIKHISSVHSAIEHNCKPAPDHS